MSTLSVALSQFTFYDPSLIRTVLGRAKSRFIFLQALVNIILSYELLWGDSTLVSPATRELLALGLWVITAPLLKLPAQVFKHQWFAAGMLVTDTVFTAAAIWLSGNANSHLFLTFFLLILVAASVRTLTMMLNLSLLLSAGYALLLYQGILVDSSVSPGHFLGIPVLLIMAVFYGLTLETVGVERQQRMQLSERVTALRYEEAELRKSREALQRQIVELKGERKQLTRAVAAGKQREANLETRLQRAQKMEAVGRLAGVVAQDFNALLRIIGLQTGELLKKAGQQESVRRHAERILAAGDRASELTGHLKEFSEQESFHQEAVPVNTTVSDLERLLSGLLPDEVSLSLELDPGVGVVKADRGQLELILMNLVVNARDAMPRGGTITIETKDVGVLTSGVPHHSDPDQRFVRIAVRDTGCGMSAEIEARLFEPFFTTKEQGGGRGLATVYGVVRRSGGTVEVKTEPGRGTVCEVYLPAVATILPVRSGGRSDRSGSRNQTVLLVDDDEIFRRLAASMLQRHDYHVLEARTAVEALLVAQRYVGSIHLVVSHAVMQDISGRELTGRLQLQHPGMKVIYLAGYTDDVFPGQDDAQSRFLKKPCSQKDLLETVTAVLP